MRIVLIVVVSVMLSGCSSNGQEAKSQGWTVTISGKVGFPQNGTISIMELRRSGQAFQDTIKLKGNYTYSKTIRIKEPGFYRLNFYNQQQLDIILDKSNVEINVDGNNPAGFFEIKGSPDIDLIKKVQGIQASVQTMPETIKLGEEFQKAQQAGDRKRMLELQTQYQAFAGDKVAEYIKAQPVSLGAINLLQGGQILDRDRYIDVYEEVAEKAKKEWPTLSYAKDFAAMVEKSKTLAIGRVAPEIALPDPSGQIVKLSSLRGKYVLIDFWAKWCGPCRRENPNVVRAYQAFKDKGFTVFGVSLDRSKEDWVKAIQEDNLTWTHVSDLKYFQSEAALLYDVNAIPFSILIDPKGVIIDKNLRDEALYAKLAEIFEKK